MVAYAYDPNTYMQRQEYQKFKVILSYRVR